ncbi:MAG: hypothetical protein ABI573_12265 [Chloroflexota bacterium]
MKGPVRTITIALFMLAAAACGTGTPSAITPKVATFEESSTAFCAAFGSLIRAVGNPDAGTPSVLSKSLDDAVAAGDIASADRAAAAITSELESGRQQAAEAARWQPAEPETAALDRVLVAFEGAITAKRAAAGHGPGSIDPQAAFEQAGGVEAWSALLAAVGSMPVPPGASPKPCPAFSGTP